MNTKENIILNLEEKKQKALVIEFMLAEVGMTRQELVDLFISVKQESEIGSGEKKLLSENESKSLDIILDGNLYEDLPKYLSLDELKKLEQKLGFALYLKKIVQLGLKIDVAKIAEILALSSSNILLKSGAKISIDGVDKVISSSQAQKLSPLLQSHISQQEKIKAQLDNPSQSQNQNDPRSQNFVSRVVGAVRTQIQSVVGAVAGGSRNDSVARMQAQIRQVESANRRLKKSFDVAKNKLGEVSGVVSNKRGDKFVTVKVRDKDGNVVSEKQVNVREVAKEKKISTSEAEKLVRDVQRAENDSKKAIEDFNKDSKDDIKILAVKVDDKGKVELDVIIKGEKKTIPAEQLSANIKQASEVAAEEKNVSIKYDVKNSSKIPEVNPKEKTEVKESIKTDDTLKKLDALHDRQKLMESLKDVKDTIKSAVHDKMDEAMQNKDFLKDLKKEKLLNPDISKPR